MPDCVDPEHEARLDQMLMATAKARLEADASIERNKQGAEARSAAPAGASGLTTADLRQARALLGWSTVTLARKAKVDYSALVRAQMAQSPAALTPDVAAIVRKTFEGAGVAFGPDGVPRLRHASDRGGPQPVKPSSA